MDVEQTFITTQAGAKLYETVRDLPIIDYHCHLSPAEIVADKPFDNIGEMWLAGDHYKWRLMREAGVEERYITGDASWKEKFLQYAQAAELAAGNPLYHWNHMELRRYFDVNETLNPETAPAIWEKANAVIRQRRLSPRKMIEMSRVEYIATTDDPADDLQFHAALRQDAGFKSKVVPSFRTDNLLMIRRAGYTDYLNRLSAAAVMEIRSFAEFIQAICRRLDVFCENGCRFSDVGIVCFPDRIATQEEAQATFETVLSGGSVDDRAFAGFLGYMYVFLGQEYCKRNMVMQWHLAVMRNVNTALFKKLGPDCGGDSMSDMIPGADIVRILDAINSSSGLPETILYTLNPAQAPLLSSIAGCFPHIRCGASWWFCDHKRGIIEQINNIAETAHIGTFLGMLTDSRSFLSYTRHDYFRRIFCSVVGEWVESGEFDGDAAERLVRAVSYENVRRLIQQ